MFRFSLAYANNIASLSISKCQARDSGKYTCTISNKHGTSTVYAEVKVKSKIKISGCTIKHIILNRQQFFFLMNFLFLFLSILGTPSFTKKPIVDKNTPGKLIIHWNPPNYTGNLPLTGYVLEYTNMGNKKWKRIEINDHTVTSKEIEHLSAGVMHQFRIKACNALGESLPSEASLPAVILFDKGTGIEY